MKVKTIKYESEVIGSSAECGVKTDACDGAELVHVCFDDGSGVTVCAQCFDNRINGGYWITDSA
jgi:hypothetical protein